MKAVHIEGGQRISRCGERISKLLFLESGVVQFNLLFRDSTQIQVAMGGIDSIVGAAALFESSHSFYETTMQTAGHGFFCLLENAQREFARHEQFHELTLGYVQMQLMQVTQLSGCNARHNVEQRLCRWLLLCQDEMPWKEICVTQEALANALGIRRTTVTLAMDELRIRGLVDYSRGRIQVLDRALLERHACECYEVLRKLRFPGDNMNKQAMAAVIASEDSGVVNPSPGVDRQTERRPRYIQ